MSDATRTSQPNVALSLSLFTVAYNVAECAASIYFSAQDHSTALLGFGIDSLVESMSGAVLIWRFWRPEGASDREHRAARLVGISMVLLAAYVTYEAMYALLSSEQAGRSLAAIIIAVASLAIMPTLYVVKRRTAHLIGSRSLHADSKQTLACTMLSVAMLAGTGINYEFGYSQADPLAALVIAGYLVKEGRDAIVKHDLCAC